MAALLLAAALALGSVHEPSSAVLEIFLWMLGAGRFLVVGGGVRERAAMGSAFALCAYLLFQQVPLPQSLIEVLSPSTAAVYRQTLGAIQPVPGPSSEITSVSRGNDLVVPVATRSRIRERGASVRAAAPGERRPLALDPMAAWRDLLRYLSYGVALGVAATAPAPLLVLRWIFYASAAIASLALVEFITWNGHVLWFFDPYDGPLAANLDRMIGPFSNPDHLASFLAMTVAPGAALLTASARSSWGKQNGLARSLLALPALALGLMVVVAATLGSASRGGITGALLGSAVFWMLARSSNGESIRPRGSRLEQTLWRAAPYALAVFVVGGGLLYAGPKGRTSLDARLGETILIPDVEFRRIMAIETLPMIRDFPVFGVGAGSWSELFLRYAHYPFVGFDPNHAHNDYVEWAAEVGIVGVILTGVLVWSLVRWFCRNQSIPAVMRAGLTGGVVAIAWQELFDFSLRVPANALLLAFLSGLLGNANWTKPPTPSTSRRHLAWKLAAVGAAVGLTFASLRQIAESWQWATVKGGSAELSIAPRYADTWTALASLLYAAGFRYRPPTEECLRTAIQLQPTSKQSFWLLSFVAPTYAARRASLEAALYLDPLRAPWRQRYAKLLEETGHPEEAVAQLEEAVYRDPRLSSHVYLDPKNARLEPAEVDAAKRGYARAIDDRPTDAMLLGEAASFHYRFEEWDEAGNLWLRAADTGRDALPLVRRAAEAFARGERYDKAETLLQRSIGDDPAGTEAYRALALSVYRPQRNYDRAAAVLEAGIRSVENPSSLYGALYELRHEQGDEKAALAALEKSVEVGGHDAVSQFQLGSAYLGAEDYHRAKVAFGRAMAADPRNAAYSYSKGVACERLYDLGGALENYRRAVALDPRNADYAKSLERVTSSLSEPAPK